MQSAIATRLSFQVECVNKWAADAVPAMVEAHWRELGLDLDLEIKPDLEAMRTLESIGRWKICTARADGRLVGYVLAVVAPHLHYSSSPKMFIVDAYYLAPEYRNGAGAKLLKFAEATARSLGAIKVYLSCKVHQDHSKLFQALGYRLSDYAFIKRL